MLYPEIFRENKHNPYIEQHCFIFRTMVEQTIFTSTFGNTAQVKVLELFLLGQDFDYSITDIAENANIGRTTLYSILDGFLEIGILKESRIIGRARMLKLNKENQIVKHLQKTFITLLKNEIKAIT